MKIYYWHDKLFFIWKNLEWYKSSKKYKVIDFNELVILIFKKKNITKNQS